MCDCEGCDKSCEAWARRIQDILKRENLTGQGLLASHACVVGHKAFGTCPACGCASILLGADDTLGFKDRASMREFLISGICQKCQDDVVAYAKACDVLEPEDLDRFHNEQEG